MFDCKIYWLIKKTAFSLLIIAKEYINKLIEIVNHNGQSVKVTCINLWIDTKYTH